jgi:hypothetical protein
VASKPEDGYIAAATASVVGVDGTGAGVDPRLNQQYYPPYYNKLASQDNAAADGTRSDEDVAKGSGKWVQRQGPFGCTVLVFVLSIVIAILAVTVVGLAAGTGVEAHRANQALASLASLQADPPKATATAAPSFASIDNNCSVQPDTVTGTMYTSFQRMHFLWSSSRFYTSFHPRANVLIILCSSRPTDIHNTLQQGCPGCALDVSVYCRLQHVHGRLFRLQQGVAQDLQRHQLQHHVRRCQLRPIVDRQEECHLWQGAGKLLPQADTTERKQPADA